MGSFKVGTRTISQGGPAFLIAEAGVNYYDIASSQGMSPLEAAKAMIDEAAIAGADAIKFQTYKANKLAIRESLAYWDTQKETTKTQYDLFRKYDSFEEGDYEQLANRARGKGIVFMSTPFDHEAVDFLTSLVPAFKIASADITNIPLMKHIAEKGKPIFLSTGAATLDEIGEAVTCMRTAGNDQIALMHCVLNYPTHYQHANLLTIEQLRHSFTDCVIGYSDHTVPDRHMVVLVAAYALGARVVEKHFTLDKSLPGNDHYHSMDARDLATLRQNLSLAEQVLGTLEKDIQREMPARLHARRSIVAKADIPRGTLITAGLVICKRPGTGISPKYWDSVIGRSATRYIKADEIISWQDIG